MGICKFGPTISSLGNYSKEISWEEIKDLAM